LFRVHLIFTVKSVSRTESAQSRKSDNVKNGASFLRFAVEHFGVVMWFLILITLNFPFRNFVYKFPNPCTIFEECEILILESTAEPLVLEPTTFEVEMA